MSAFGPTDIWSFNEFKEIDPEGIKEKNRNWNAIVYPESAPEDWIDQLRDLHLPFAVSPLHDSDVNPTGELKKAHYHIIVSFEGPTTMKNANRTIQQITCGPIVKVCRSVRGSYRYFTHIDNPEKFQYSGDQIQIFNDFEIAMSSSDEDMIKNAIFNIILINQVYEFNELVILLKYNFGYEYAKVARQNHSYIAAIVNSFRHSPAVTYKRFMKYITPEEWDMYAVEEQFNYDNSFELISDVIGKEAAIEKKKRRKERDPDEEN